MSRRKQGEYTGEDDVKDAIKKILAPFIKAEHMHVWMPGATMYGVSGTHDFCQVHLSLFWTVEAKYANNKPTENQVTFSKKVQKAGGLCLCINEINLWEVQMAADYIQANGRIPHHMNHDFAQLARGKKA